MDAQANIRKALNEVGDTGKDAVYELVIPMSTTGGMFRFNFVGHQTAPIPYPATREAIEAALFALTNIGNGNVEVLGLRGGPYRVHMKKDLGGQPLPLATYSFTADGSQLNPPSSLALTQIEVGKLPILKSEATAIWQSDASEAIYNERLRFLYLKRDLLDLLLGESHKGVDTETANGTGEKLSQQHGNLLKMRATVQGEITGIENPTGGFSSTASNQAAATITGRILKRTSDGFPYNPYPNPYYRRPR